MQDRMEMEDGSGAKEGNGQVSTMPSYLERMQNKIKCSFCTRTIGKSFFVKCAVCESVLLCADCFVAGVRMPPHNSSHPYRVAECLDNTSIFQKDWSAKEELLLLDGIQKHGMGNWKVIADAMDTNKTAKQVEEHYWEGYMGVHGYCLPATTLSNSEQKETASGFPDVTEDLDSILQLADGLSMENVVQRVAQVNQHYAEALAQDLYHIAVNLTHTRGEKVQRDVGKNSKATSEAKDRLATLPGSDLPGFMPLREDFEVEYENDAEQVLALMDFNPDDHPSETALKLQVIRIYNRKLQERNERKRFVIDRGLVDFKTQQAKERKLTKEEREEVARFRVFARFMAPGEYDALVAGILTARRLQQQIDLFKHYMALGLQTVDEVHAHEESKKRSALAARIQRQSASYLTSAASHLVSSTGTSSSTSLGSSQAAGGSARGPTGGENGGEQKKRRGRPPKNPVPETSPAPVAVAAPPANSATSESVPERSGSPDSSVAAGSTTDKRTRRESWQGGSGLAGGMLVGAAEAMRKAPQADLLTDKEMELCVGVPLLPAHYLAIREALLREAHEAGLLTMEGVHRAVKLSDAQKEMIFDFMIKEVLIEPRSAR